LLCSPTAIIAIVGGSVAMIVESVSIDIFSSF
jgi:hypothetical protein